MNESEKRLFLKIGATPAETIRGEGRAEFSQDRALASICKAPYGLF
ncbi:hypothetical protein LFX25_17405 [Leptospira sp. FAT2]|nr:hypothetical protein [Leptospira sanjuanensis]MCG6169620.1 hypothetical protein [Leptospira sanjuanensis]MCG6195019.1 hypothetical protein [Leptospira sanjuanensis]